MDRAGFRHQSRKYAEGGTGRDGGFEKCRRIAEMIDDQPGEPEPATDHCDQPDFGLAPMLRCDEKDIQERPQRSALVGEQEVQCVG